MIMSIAQTPKKNFISSIKIRNLGIIITRIIKENAKNGKIPTTKMMILMMMMKSQRVIIGIIIFMVAVPFIET